MTVGSFLFLALTRISPQSRQRYGLARSGKRTQKRNTKKKEYRKILSDMWPLAVNLFVSRKQLFASFLHFPPTRGWPFRSGRDILRITQLSTKLLCMWPAIIIHPLAVSSSPGSPSFPPDVQYGRVTFLVLFLWVLYLNFILDATQSQSQSWVMIRSGKCRWLMEARRHGQVGGADLSD